MAKLEENEEGIPAAEPTADDDEGKSRRGILRRIGLTAAALAATNFLSSKASAQGERKAQEKQLNEREILAELRKQGITTLQQLAHNAAAGGQSLRWCFIVKGKFIYRDDDK
jgi:hypothetical protein